MDLAWFSRLVDGVLSDNDRFKAITVAGETTTSGGINLQDATAVTVGSVGSIPVNRVTGNGAAAPTTTAPLTGLATASNGAIVLATLAGTVTLAQSVIANGSGNVLINAVGSAANVTGNAGVQSTTGNITIVGGLGVTFGAADNVETTGSVDVEAATGSAAFNQDSLVSSGGGNVRVLAAVSVTVGGINAGTGSVALSAGATGSILDGGDADYTNVTAAALWLSAGAGIGSGATPLKTAVGAVTALWVAAGLAILGGRGLLKVIPVKWLSRGAAVVMLVLAGLTVAALF